jgi:head-tail adaptor
MSLPRLTRQMILETPVKVDDNAGGHETTWAPLGTLFADVKSGTGRQSGDLVATLSKSAVRVIVRAAVVGAPSRPKAGQRFREGSSVFRIDAVTPFDRGAHYLTCFAVEETVV